MEKPMSSDDQARIAQLERDNSQLREVLKGIVAYVAWDDDLHKSAERIRGNAKKQLREADLLDSIALLLK
jgi:hypothetical protein